VQAKGQAPVFFRDAVGHQGVAGSGANALAHPVCKAGLFNSR
jgi:hypothetical protein